MATPRKKTIRTVLMADLVDSKQVAQRKAFEKKLRTLVREINKDPTVRIEITQGIDLVVGVMPSLQSAWQVAECLTMGVFPEAFRFGIGVGEIDIAGDGDDINAMDGTAFHAAAAAVAEAEESGTPFRLRLAEGAQPKQDKARFAAEIQLVEANLSLMQTIRSQWTERGAQIVSLYEKLGTQQATAKRLKISQQAVSKVLRQGHYKVFAAAKHSLSAMLLVMDGVINP